MKKTCFQYFFLAALSVSIFSAVPGCKKKSSDSPDRSLPGVTTNSAVTVLTTLAARSGGTVTSQGGSAVTARGICYSIAPNLPTIEGSHTRDGTGEGSFSSALTLPAGDTIYFVRAYATNSNGTAYGNRVSFFSNPEQPFYPGQSYGGGILFYIDYTGKHGLIAATSEYGAPWGCSGLSIPGTARTLNTGNPNTVTIMEGCLERPIAASICAGMNQGGKSDWFLPSKEELNQMYLKKDFIGDFGNDNYWCSSQYDASHAYSQNFLTGAFTYSAKNEVLWVRAVRVF